MGRSAASGRAGGLDRGRHDDEQTEADAIADDDRGAARPGRALPGHRDPRPRPRRLPEDPRRARGARDPGPARRAHRPVLSSRRRPSSARRSPGCRTSTGHPAASSSARRSRLTTCSTDYRRRVRSRTTDSRRSSGPPRSAGRPKTRRNRRLGPEPRRRVLRADRAAPDLATGTSTDAPQRNRLGTVARFTNVLADYESVTRRSRRDPENPGEQVGGAGRQRVVLPELRARCSSTTRPATTTTSTARRTCSPTASRSARSTAPRASSGRSSSCRRSPTAASRRAGRAGPSDWLLPRDCSTPPATKARTPRSAACSTSR